PYYKRVLEMRRRLLPPEHLDLATSLKDMGDLLSRTGELNTAETYYRESLQIRRKLMPPYHPGMATILEKLGALLMRKRNYADAEPVLSEAVIILSDRFGNEHRRSANVQSILGECDAQLGRYTQAERLLLDSFAILRKNRRSDGDLRSLQEAGARIVSLYRAWGKDDRAADWEDTLQDLSPQPATTPNE